MKFCLLASGSRGNAVWVESDGVAVLIDSGLSARELKGRAAQAGLDITRLSAILLSHEHSDHIKGVGPLARLLKLPVLANQGTAAGAAELLGQVRLERFTTGDTLSLGPFKARTVPVSHDAADPVAFVFDGPSGPLGLATDLGAVTRLVEEKFKGLRALILEFNHDFRMLMDGPYPWPLKQRVRGRQGHLPNNEAAELAARLYHADLRHLVLAHLSETNNSPALALAAAKAALGEALTPVAAGQHQPTAVFEF